MGIQDLGAIGEFVSSVVIVITLIVLIYEVRGAKKATLRGIVQERARKREFVQRAVMETPHLAAIWTKADEHAGDTTHTKPKNLALSPTNGDNYGRFFVIFFKPSEMATTTNCPKRSAKRSNSRSPT